MTLFQNKLHYWLFMSFIAQYTITFQFLHISFHYTCVRHYHVSVMCFCFVFKYIFFYKKPTIFQYPDVLVVPLRSVDYNRGHAQQQQQQQQQRCLGVHSSRDGRASLEPKDKRERQHGSVDTLSRFSQAVATLISRTVTSPSPAPPSRRVPKLQWWRPVFSRLTHTHTHRRIKRFMQTTAAVSETSTMALYCTQALYNM